MANINHHISYLKEQIHDLEESMNLFVESTEAFRAKDDPLAINIAAKRRPRFGHVTIIGQTKYLKPTRVGEH